MTDEEKLFERSKAAWGLKFQILMLAEESAELAVAALHLERANKDLGASWENFAEEIADIEFLIAEMRYYFPWLDAKIFAYRAKKRNRLAELLGKSEGNNAEK